MEGGIKLIALLTKRADLEREGFVERYEAHHAPCAVRLLPYFERYRRNFPIGPFVVGHITGDREAAFPCDAITEMWYEDRARITDQMEAVAGEKGVELADDERRLFDRGRMAMLEATEHVTPEARLQRRPVGHPGKPAVKVMGLLRRREGMSRAAFRDYYESGHVELALELIQRDEVPLFAAYSRSYVCEDKIFALGDPPGFQVDFDVITQMSFWTEADFEAFMSLTTNSEVAELLTKDEKSFFDRDSVHSFFVDERDTDPDDIRRAMADVQAERDASAH